MSCLSLVFISSTPSLGQQIDFQKNKTVFGGLTLRTNGLGLCAGVKKTTGSYHQMFQLDAVTHKHPQEIKIVNPNIQNPRPYVFGKLYRTALVRSGFGLEKALLVRNDWNRLGLYAQWMVGPELAIQRPVFLDIYRTNFNDNTGYISSERYDPTVHTSQEEVVGYSNTENGWDEVEYRVGMQSQLSVSMQWAGENGGYKGFRIGGVLDYYPGGLPLMAFAKNPKSRGTLFVTFIWAK
jgi:hypothetical protein